MRETTAASDIYHVIEWNFQQENENRFVCAIKKKKNCGKISIEPHMTSSE